ncbi:GNAT family N-acetyltransferase [Nostoc sp.]|uniref:GNAT family N-acetyltransferase n=1 Tax=Nostoc sp. TaxID=1180 RepID=UPI003FA5617B
MGEVKLDRIVAIAHPENIASVRVIQKVGMKYQKNASYYGHDVVYFAISHTEWQADNCLYLLQS